MEKLPEDASFLLRHHPEAAHVLYYYGRQNRQVRPSYMVEHRSGGLLAVAIPASARLQDGSLDDLSAFARRGQQPAQQLGVVGSLCILFADPPPPQRLPN